MSAKYFCDICGNEMRTNDHDRIRRKLGDVEIEVMSAFKGAWNGGHLCHGCVVKAITKGKPSKGMTALARARAAAAE